MKWISHQTGALVGAAALGLSLPAIGGALFGSILPDVVDQKISSLGGTRKRKQRIFNRIHRGASHWFGWWLLALAAAPGTTLPGAEVLAGLGFGALSHIFLDMLTTRGVPILPGLNNFRIALRLCSTGKPSEYLTIAVLVILTVFCFQKQFSAYLLALI